MAIGVDMTGLETLSYSAGGVTLLLILRYIYKIIRRDVTEVKESEQRESVLDHYKDLAERYRREADEHARRAESFAQERNRAVEELGKLRGEVVRLTGQVESLEAKIQHLTQTIEFMNRFASVTEPGAPGFREPIN